MSKHNGREEGDLLPIRDVLLNNSVLKPPTPVEMRLIESSADIKRNLAEEISFQHTVLCQTGLRFGARQKLPCLARLE